MSRGRKSCRIILTDVSTVANKNHTKAHFRSYSDLIGEWAHPEIEHNPIRPKAEPIEARPGNYIYTQHRRYFESPSNLIGQYPYASVEHNETASNVKASTASHQRYIDAQVAGNDKVSKVQVCVLESALLSSTSCESA